MIVMNFRLNIVRGGLLVIDTHKYLRWGLNPPLHQCFKDKSCLPLEELIRFLGFKKFRVIKKLRIGKIDLSGFFQNQRILHDQ